MTILSNKPIWHELQDHAEQMLHISMQDLFLADVDRPKHYNIAACGLSCDYSKNRLTDVTLQLLLQLADVQQLPLAITRLFAGEQVNVSERRAALHTLLRAPKSSVAQQHQSKALDVERTLAQMRSIADAVRSGTLTGFSGQPITDIINVGIGGSDLGPMMLSRALSPYASKALQLHFFSVCDKAYIDHQLSQLNPATTLVVVVSKSFTTQETLLNAQYIKDWMLAAASNWEAVVEQWFAVTAQMEKARDFGVPSANILPMWDWVGGRYSVWSAVSLASVIALGVEHFDAFLQGAYAMDQHFQTAPLAENMPVLLGLIGVWYQNFLDASTHLVVPYSAFLDVFPRYLQQLFMESQGKSVTLQGESVEYATGAIVWGESGTNSQHSFHQLLMQGTHCVPVDFILPLANWDDSMNLELVSHCFAQSQVLMEGYSGQAVSTDTVAHEEAGSGAGNHKKISGNVPSNMLLLNRLDGYHLGALVAMYEHIVYVQSVIWDINAFDQWGVERGKVIAKGVLQDIQQNTTTQSYDSSTQQMINNIIQQRGNKS